MIIFSRLPPNSVQVVAWKISTVVAIVNTICIYHWNHIKLITFFPTLEITLNQPLYYSLSDVRSLRFSRMLSCQKNSTWSSLIPFQQAMRTWKFSLNKMFLMGKHINKNRKSSQSFCNFDLLNFECICHSLQHNLIEKNLQIKRSIRKTVRKSNHIIFVRWSILKMKRIVRVVLVIFPWNTVRFIGNWMAAFSPSYFSISFGCLRKESYTHTFLVERTWFCLNCYHEY